MVTAGELLSNEVIVTLLAVVLIVAVAYLRTVGPRRAIVGELVRTQLWRALDRPGRRRGRPLLRDKTHSGDEYICSVDESILTVARALWSGDYSWNPLSTKKYRDGPHGRQYGVLSVAYRKSIVADDQHHVYCFRRDDGRLDLYGHHESNITDPDAHHGGEQVPGDPARFCRGALEDAGIEWTQLPIHTDTNISSDTDR